jgi:hypothetical protein
MDFVDGMDVMDGVDNVEGRRCRGVSVGADHCQAWRVQEAEELSAGAAVL